MWGPSEFQRSYWAEWRGGFEGSKCRSRDKSWEGTAKNCWEMPGSESVAQGREGSALRVPSTEVMLNGIPWREGMLLEAKWIQGQWAMGSGGFKRDSGEGPRVTGFVLWSPRVFSHLLLSLRLELTVRFIKSHFLDLSLLALDLQISGSGDHKVSQRNKIGEVGGTQKRWDKS